MSKAVESRCKWVYEGVWRLLTNLLYVPREPPDLPMRPGETLMRRRPDAGWLAYRKLVFWVLALLLDAGLLVLWGLTALIEWWVPIVIAPIALILIVVPDIFAYIGVHLRYDTTWYVISPRSVRIRRGVWIISEITVTFENIQDVKITQGPIQRYFGFADLLVQVAGGGGGTGQQGDPFNTHKAIIEGVEDARELRDLILTRVHASRSAGLGDDRDAPAPGRAPAPAWSPEHIAVLREIRDLARQRSGG